jgi:hypothetical protein
MCTPQANVVIFVHMEKLKKRDGNSLIREKKIIHNRS